MTTYNFSGVLTPPGVNGGTTGFYQFATMTPPAGGGSMSDVWNLTTSGVATFSVMISATLTGPPGSVKLLSLSDPSNPLNTLVTGAHLISFDEVGIDSLAIGYSMYSGYYSGDATIGGFRANFRHTQIHAEFQVDSPSNIQIPVSGYSWYPGGGGDPINYTIEVNYLTASSDPPPPAQDDFSDSLADTSSPKGSLVVNGAATGTLEAIGDHDWFSVQLASGQTYVIDMRGSPSSGGTLSDAYLRLHNSAGTLLVENDDDGVGADSQLTVSVTTGGTFYVNAGAYNDEHAGTYTVEIRALAPSLPGSISISDATISEGNNGTTFANFTVTRTGGTAAFTVNFVTADGIIADGTASVADNDYVAKSGTLSFGANVNSQTISVVINGDLKPEASETFFVSLVNPSAGVTISDGFAVGTIINDDNHAPVITSNGGGDTATITVPQGTTKVTNVTVADFDGNLVGFSIVGGADAARFQNRRREWRIVVHNAAELRCAH